MSRELRIAQQILRSWPLRLACAGLALLLLRLIVPLGTPVIAGQVDNVLVRQRGGFSLQDPSLGGLRDVQETLARVIINYAINEPAWSPLGFPLRITDRVAIELQPDHSGTRTPEASEFLADAARVNATITEGFNRSLGQLGLTDLLTAGGGQRERWNAKAITSTVLLACGLVLLASSVALLIRPSAVARRAKSIATNRCPRCGFGLDYTPRRSCHKCNEPFSPEDMVQIEAMRAARPNPTTESRGH